MRRNRKRIFALLRGAFLASLVAVQLSIAMAIAAQKSHTTQFGQVDFNTYYAAALLFSQGQNMYDGALTKAVLRGYGLAYIEGSNYIYPPYLAALLSFGISLDPLTFGFLWYLASLIALALALWLILRGQSYALGEAFQRWQYCLIFAFLFAPTGHSFYVGQINAFLLFFFAGAFFALIRGWEVISGLLLGVATLIKVAPGILAVHLLASRRFTAFSAMIFTVIGIPTATLPFFKDQLGSYFLTVPVRLSNTMAHPVNQSLNGFFSRLLTENAFTVPLYAGSTALVQSLVVLTGLIVLGVVVLRYASGMELLAPRNADLSFGIPITLIVVLSPFAWENLYLILLFPYLTVFRRWNLLQRRHQVLLAVSILFIEGQRLWDPFTNAPFEHPLLRYLSPLMSLGLYGALMLIYIQLHSSMIRLQVDQKGGSPGTGGARRQRPSPDEIRDQSRSARGGSRPRPPGPPPRGRSTAPAAGGP